MALRGQATASDARAERLVRRVRDELDQLRETLAGQSGARDVLLTVSAADVAANPEVAESIDPTILVRSLVAAAATEQELRGRLASRDAEVSALRHQLTEIREGHARDAGRLETLEQVLAALHDNLEDLRTQRAFVTPGPAPERLPESTEPS